MYMYMYLGTWVFPTPKSSASVLIVELHYLNSFYQGKKLPFRWHLYLGYQLYCTKSQSKLEPCESSRQRMTTLQLNISWLGLNLAYTGPHPGLG